MKTYIDETDEETLCWCAECRPPTAREMTDKEVSTTRECETLCAGCYRRLVPVGGSAVRLREGSEGPRYDPYAFEEIEVRRADGRTVTLHRGLACWVRLDGDIVCQHAGSDETFEELAGVSAAAARRALVRRRSRCGRCGCRELEWHEGFPGESIALCARCGEPVDSTFDESAVR